MLYSGTDPESYITEFTLVRRQHEQRLGLDRRARPPHLLFFFITLKSRVEWYQKSMSLEYEPALEPLHISVK